MKVFRSCASCGPHHSLKRPASRTCARPFTALCCDLAALFRQLIRSPADRPARQHHDAVGIEADSEGPAASGCRRARRRHPAGPFGRSVLA